ncbi:hypothetical protein [Williamwhitmania taraxaci]|uniref:hypothetical protein n=1 Tax=Williamwhitmania taraxaci TaxID=1640674 RepID=UPI001FCD9BD5|nr:hypothetical protein [Williamwhitmania taraxaci]
MACPPNQSLAEQLKDWAQLINPELAVVVHPTPNKGFEVLGYAYYAFVCESILEQGIPYHCWQAGGLRPYAKEKGLRLRCNLKG